MLSSPKNRSLLIVLLHVFTWVVLFMFPVFLSNSESSAINYNRLIKFTWIPLLFYAVIFYSNYFFLIERLLFRKKMLVFVLVNVSLILLFTWLHFEVKELLNMAMTVKPVSPDHLPPAKPPVKLFVYKDVISMIIPLIIAFTVKTNEKWSKAETEKKEREKDILNAELQHLKYQLQPHFFFNALNTIYALIERSPAAAQETVHKLGKLMRYMLYETESGKINLKEDIEFMTQYIALMKLRLSDKTKVHTHFQPVAANYEITPLLFISLIENAFKHGISATQESELFFSMTAESNTIRFTAENTNFPKNEKDVSGSGIGLLNLRKRLELTYPGQYIFTTNVEGSQFKVLLEINLARS